MSDNVVLMKDDYIVLRMLADMADVHGTNTVQIEGRDHIITPKARAELQRYEDVHGVVPLMDRLMPLMAPELYESEAK